MTCRPDPRPSFTPPQTDWLVWQALAHAAPALDSEIRTLNKYKNQLSAILAEKTEINASQREVLTAILDQLAKRGLIYASADDKLSGDD